MFVKPRDRDVVCHASAWDVDAEDDLRIKMCIDITGEHFTVIHHELGHNFYQRAYNQQPYLFRESANEAPPIHPNCPLTNLDPGILRCPRAYLVTRHSPLWPLRHIKHVRQPHRVL